MRCFFASDLHGHDTRYRSLFSETWKDIPDAVLLGGDLLPMGLFPSAKSKRFLDRMKSEIQKIRVETETRFFIILGNDDPRTYEQTLLEWDLEGVIHYVHYRTVPLGDLFVTGYSYIPVSPFSLKDWEKYDVSRYICPGCVPIEDGVLTTKPPKGERGSSTIKEDLEILERNAPPRETIFLFHTPPADSSLDRIDTNGRIVDHVPMDEHVGSHAVSRFITLRKPYLTLHGHIHESTRLTGKWREVIDGTHALSAAHDGPQLALVKFDTKDLEGAQRILI